MRESSPLERACFGWMSAASVEPVPEVLCRSGILLDGTNQTPRFCYVSVGSPIEQLFSTSPQGRGSLVTSAEGREMALEELDARLVDGEVAAVLMAQAGLREGSVSESTVADVVLSTAFEQRRQEIRSKNVLIRFLLRQIGLAEVSSHRGAPAALYWKAQALWSLDLSLCTDPAMLLTLGADRQRYVDPSYEERAIDRLPRALGRLHDLGIRAYPRLVIV